MRFTDLFIRRPVLATVVSLIILLVGLRAGMGLTVREYPKIRNAQINVSVFYPGADAELMQGFVTTPLEREIASADGIDYLNSNTQAGASVITANLRLDKDPNAGLTEISAKVNKLRNQLPEGAEDPVIEIAEGQTAATMYLAFRSPILDNNQITDYLVRVVEPQISAVPGVQKAEIFGGSSFAMRIWLKPDRLTAYNLTAGEVYEVLRSNNFLSALGETRGSYVKVKLSAQTDLHTADEFRQLVVRSENGSVVRLGDIAEVVLGAENYDQYAAWNGSNAIFIGIRVMPDANVLDVIAGVHKIWPEIVRQLPEGLKADIAHDNTGYIREAIKEVRSTLAEAVLVVVVVIFLFLGSLRSVIIPAVTVPLSLVGALFLMLLMGFSINLLTLLAMVLAIGMVVDDAIVMLENVHRHIENGMKPFDAAIQGARELVGPITAMTITLVSVYAPIGFLGGLTGKLFTEFAFTLAGAVLLSGVIALTLTPMMCARLLTPSSEHGEHKLEAWLDRQFEKFKRGYKRRLHGVLDTKAVIGVFGVIVLVSCYFLFKSTPSELAPQEDIGMAGIYAETDAYSTLEYFNQYNQQVGGLIKDVPEVEGYFTLAGFGMGSNSGFTGMVMAPWSQRKRSTEAVVNEVQPKITQIAGLRTSVFVPPPLPTPGRGYPVEFAITGTKPAMELYELGEEILARAMATKKFLFLVTELRIDQPQAKVEINRDKAALLGIDMRRLSTDLSALLAGGEVGRFSLDHRSYKVIPQVKRDRRLNPEQLQGYYTRTADGRLVPIANLVTIKEGTTSRGLSRFQQMNSNVLLGVPRPGVTLGEALGTLEQIAHEVLPKGFQVDYAGQSRQFKKEGSALLITFGFSLIIIYLVLAAQFESFRDPFIMLVTVPMSICGALLALNLFGIMNGFQLTHFPGMTLNIYTQVGLLTLVGVISKHGILIVEFANKLQQQGASKREAIEEAASIRLRPVLMTTAALVVAMVPLLTASGPGAAARFSMGLVIATGMSIGTMFTLYVVPAMYLYLGRDYAVQRAATSGVRSVRTLRFSKDKAPATLR